MGENGAAYGSGPVVENRSEVIDPGTLIDVGSQQLEKGKEHQRRCLVLGSFPGMESIPRGMGRRTFDWLRFEEVVNHGFKARSANFSGACHQIL